MGFLDEERCAVCGKSEDYVHLDNHHDLLNSRGGTETIKVCRQCHQWIHSHPKEAEEKGFIIKGYKTIRH